MNAINENLKQRLIETGARTENFLKGSRYHYFTHDLKRGGHLLEGEFLNPAVDVETLRDWRITLPLQYGDEFTSREAIVLKNLKVEKQN